MKPISARHTQHSTSARRQPELLVCSTYLVTHYEKKVVISASAAVITENTTQSAVQGSSQFILLSTGLCA